MAEVHAPNALLMGLILRHILPSGNVPNMYHPFIVAAGQVCLEVLVPGETTQLGASAELLAWAVRLCSRVGHDRAVLINADAL